MIEREKELGDQARTVLCPPLSLLFPLIVVLGDEDTKVRACERVVDAY